MLCIECQNILHAKSTRVQHGEEWKFKHHENGRALQTSADAGCQMCLLFWNQLSDQIRRDMTRTYGQESNSDSQAHHSYYTINEYMRDRGYYQLSGGCDAVPSTSSPELFRIYFIHAKG